MTAAWVWFLLFLAAMAGWTWEHALVMRYMAGHRRFLENLAEAQGHRRRLLEPYKDLPPISLN